MRLHAPQQWNNARGGGAGATGSVCNHNNPLTHAHLQGSMIGLLAVLGMSKLLHWRARQRFSQPLLADSGLSCCVCAPRAFAERICHRVQSLWLLKICIGDLYWVRGLGACEPGCVLAGAYRLARRSDCVVENKGLPHWPVDQIDRDLDQSDGPPTSAA